MLHKYVDVTQCWHAWLLSCALISKSRICSWTNCSTAYSWTNCCTAYWQQLISGCPWWGENSLERPLLRIGWQSCWSLTVSSFFSIIFFCVALPLYMQDGARHMLVCLSIPTCDVAAVCLSRFLLWIFSLYLSGARRAVLQPYLLAYMNLWNRSYWRLFQKTLARLLIS